MSTIRSLSNGIASSLKRIHDLASSSTITAVRLGSGSIVGRLGKRPEKLIDFYDKEACPYCRKVREAMSTLDIDANMKPCPKGGSVFRKELVEKGGKEQVPFIIDPNTGTQMYESDKIVEYLYKEYSADGKPAFPTDGMAGLNALNLSYFNTLNSQVVTAMRIFPSNQGYAKVRAHMPEQRLELYSFEASPHARLVREALCSLEIPYVLHNVALNSPKRAEFAKRAGKVQIPFLIDPNTGVEMFESDHIIQYLYDTYAI